MFMNIKKINNVKFSKKKTKITVLAISLSIILVFSLLCLLFLGIGNFRAVKYLEINDYNEVQLKGKYINIEDLFGEERFTKEEIKKIKDMSKDLDIEPKEYVLASYLKTGIYDSLFNDVDTAELVISELEKNYQSKISDLYREKMLEDPYIDIIIRGKLSDKSEMKHLTNLTIPPRLLFKNVKGISTSGLVDLNVDNLIISEGIEYISDNAFVSSQIKTIALPDSVNLIGVNVLSRCEVIEYVNGPSLKNLDIKNDNQIFLDVYLEND